MQEATLFSLGSPSHKNLQDQWSIQAGLCTLTKMGWKDLVVVVCTIVSTAAVAIGVALVIPQIRTIRRTYRLEAVLRFLELMREWRDLRKFIFREFPEAKPSASLEELIDFYSTLPEEYHEKAQLAIAYLNDVGLLLEKKIVPKREIFGMYHTIIIRLCHLLIPYARVHEIQIGGRYGRRLDRLERRAKLYHDLSPWHRRTTIKLYRGKQESKEIYRTAFQHGFKGILQRLTLLIRRIFQLY